MSEPATLGQALAGAVRRLSDAGIDTAALDARVLLAHAADCAAHAPRLHPERPLAAAAARRL